MQRKLSGMEALPWKQRQLDQIPILHVRGTNYVVGYTIVSLICSFEDIYSRSRLLKHEICNDYFQELPWLFPPLGFLL
jgi:hypothetical protein